MQVQDIGPEPQEHLLYFIYIGVIYTVLLIKSIHFEPVKIKNTRRIIPPKALPIVNKQSVGKYIVADSAGETFV